MRLRIVSISVSIILTSVLIFLVACSSGSGSGGATTAKVNVSFSDPPTCSSSTGGAYNHIYVTIKDVKIHQSAMAGPNDSGWIDLTPNLSSAPMQVDLLGLANNQCFLAMLGSNTEIQPGNYQQIRVYLSDQSDAGKITNNQCSGNNLNCVVLAADNSIHPLQLSSETQTGIKIPSGQLAGGKFTVAAGEVKDLNIDFDGCASIVIQGNGQYRLKPVLHAGEVSLTSSSVTGKLIDSATNQPIVGGKAIVALEQKDANGIDRVIMQTTPDANGNFVICPAPAGTFDVVAVAVNGSGVAYAATITSGVQAGNALGNIPLIAQTGNNTSMGSITGQITTTNGAAAPADLTVYAMQTVTLGSSVNVIIPLAEQSSATASVTTAAGTCPTNTACVTYTLAVPAMWPNIGTFNPSGTTYSQSTTTPVSYSVGADAFQPGSGSTAFCSPSMMSVNTLSGGGALTVSAGQSSTAATMAFTGCQ